MYARDLLELMQWDTLYHEHLTFYSLGTLRTLLERHGFHLVHAERIPMHGGSLRVAAALKPGEASDELRAVEEYEREEKLTIRRHGSTSALAWPEDRDRAGCVRRGTRLERIWVMAPPARRRCG